MSAIIPHLKAIHVAMLSVWCAGLFAMPLMLSRHDPAIGQADYSRIRRATHHGYTFVLTPAAVLAIASGTILIYLREAFVPWLYAKLVVVALLVAFHAWVGGTLVRIAETEGGHPTPEPGWPVAILVLIILAILALVLLKPELGEIPLPGWLLEPQGNQFPFDVPSR